MVTTEQLKTGIAAYLDTELMPLMADNALQKVLVGTGLGIALRRSDAIIDELKSNKMVQVLGIMDDQGNVDIDILHEELKKNMVAEGVSINIPVLGVIKLTSTDIDKLYSHIMNSGNQQPTAQSQPQGTAM